MSTLGDAADVNPVIKFLPHTCNVCGRKPHDMYASPNIIRVITSRKMRSAGRAIRTEERRGTYKVLVAKLEVKRPLGRSRRRWEDNIKMELTVVAWEGWTRLIWLRIETGCGATRKR